MVLRITVKPCWHSFFFFVLQKYARIFSTPHQWRFCTRMIKRNFVVALTCLLRYRGIECWKIRNWNKTDFAYRFISSFIIKEDFLLILLHSYETGRKWLCTYHTYHFRTIIRKATYFIRLIFVGLSNTLIMRKLLEAVTSVNIGQFVQN